MISAAPSSWTAASLGFDGDVRAVSGVVATAVVGAVVPVVDVGPERDAVDLEKSQHLYMFRGEDQGADTGERHTARRVAGLATKGSRVS